MKRFLVLVLLSGPVLGQEDVPELIERLGSERYEERAFAREELVRRGLSVRAALRPAVAHEDLEIGRAAAAILAEIDRRFLRQAIEEAPGLRESLIRPGERGDRFEEIVDALVGSDVDRFARILELSRSAPASQEALEFHVLLHERWRGVEGAARLSLRRIGSLLDALGGGLDRAVERGVGSWAVLEALLELPDGSVERIRGLVGAASASKDPRLQRRLLDLAASESDPRLAPVLEGLVPAGAEVDALRRATQAYLGDAGALERGLARLGELPEDAMARFLRAALVADRRPLPPQAIELAIGAEDPVRGLARALVARLGSAQERSRLPGSLDLLGRVLRRPEGPPGQDLARFAFVEGEEEAQLALLAVLCDEGGDATWAVLEAGATACPFPDLPEDWPRHVAHLGGARSVPLLERMVHDSNVGPPCRASALRGLLERHPGRAGPAARRVADYPYDDLGFTEGDRLLDWARNADSPDAVRVAGAFLSSLERIDPDRQLRAVAILSSKPGGADELARFFASPYLESQPREVLLGAIEAARELGGPAAIDGLAVLISRFEVLDPDVVHPAMRALASLAPRDPRTIPLLESANRYEGLTSPPGVEILAELAAGGVPGALAACLARLSRGHASAGEPWYEAVVATALEATRGSDAVVWTAALRHDPLRPISRRVLDRFRSLPRPEAAESLWRLAVDGPDPETCRDSLAAVREITGLDLPAEAAGPEADRAAAIVGSRRIEAWLRTQGRD